MHQFLHWEQTIMEWRTPVTWRLIVRRLWNDTRLYEKKKSQYSHASLNELDTFWEMHRYRNVIQCNAFSFGYLPGVQVLKADVSELSVSSIFIGRSIDLPMKMEPIKCSETSAFSTRTPGRYPKENALHIKHGESLKSGVIQCTCTNLDSTV